MSRVSVGRIIVRGYRGSWDLDLSSISIEIHGVSFEDSVSSVLEYMARSRGISLEGASRVNLEGSLVSPEFIGGKRLLVPLTFTILSRGDDYIDLAPIGYDDIEKRSGLRILSRIPFDLIRGGFSLLLTRSSIYPFALARLFKILYRGSETRDLVRRIYGDLGPILSETLARIKIPLRPSIYRAIEQYVVIYKCQRSFAASVIEPATIEKILGNGVSGVIMDHHVSSIYTKNMDIAYYYAGVLNYMAYKVLKLELGGFARDQFGRPLLALKEAGLEWRDSGWQHEVSAISQKIHGMRREILRLSGLGDLELFEIIDQGADNKIIKTMRRRTSDMLGLVERYIEEIASIIDMRIDIKNLSRALKKYVIETSIH